MTPTVANSHTVLRGGWGRVQLPSISFREKIWDKVETRLCAEERGWSR